MCEGKAKLFQSETSYIELIALCVDRKHSEHLRSHSTAIMALDHSRLSLENKLLKTNQAEFFCVRQVYFTNSCQQIWVYVNQSFILLYITSEMKQYYHTDLGQNAVLHNFSRQIALSKYSGRSIVGFQRNRSKNFQNHPHGQLVLISSASCQCGQVFK